MKKLHIVCHTVPYPADYGGVIDIFHKIKCLKEAGVEITLHCFTYDRISQSELTKYCTEIFYYKRFTGCKGFAFFSPYIVNSRKHKNLLFNLTKNNNPILLEGIHCTGFVRQLLKCNRKTILRLPNVESIYYRNLFNIEKSIFKKIFFLYESILLKLYEKSLPKNLPILSISKSDTEYCTNLYKQISTTWLPAFVPFSELKIRSGIGSYCLYHGNLSINENEEAVSYLIENVFSKTNIPFVIAGKTPSKQLIKEAGKHKNIQIIFHPSDEELQELVSNAQINILPSFNNTGIKLKLLNVLFNGRHCVVNDSAVKGSGLELACHISSNEITMLKMVTNLFEQPFNNLYVQKREKIVMDIYNNSKTTQQLIEAIW